MRNILFPTDFSKSANHALEFAVYMAEMGNKSLNILNVYNTPVVVSEDFSTEMITTMRLESKANAEKDIQNLKEELAVKHPWLNVNTFVEYGFIAETIHACAEENACDYIVMGTHGATGIMDKIMGSSTLGVIETSTIPVWAIPQDAKLKEVKSILYASDYSGDEKTTISEVLSFATIFEIETHVIHVHEENEPEIVPAETITQQLRDHFKGSRISFRNLNRNDATEGIEHYIINQKPEVLALARHHRGFWSSILHSSVTKHFALASKTPILVLYKAD